MKKEANAGALTNFEVLDILRSKGASKDPTRVIVPIAPSEFKIFKLSKEQFAEKLKELANLVIEVLPEPPT